MDKSKRNYFRTDSGDAITSFAEHLFKKLIIARDLNYDSIVFLFIGSDRSTGDSLGPMIGHKLCHFQFDDIFFRGTLESPVHARNLSSAVSEVSKISKNPFIIAVDACLGRMENVGMITLGDGPIKPGSGVNKDLAPVGNIHITGIVNYGGFMDFIILQNTRLSIVVKMADAICEGIELAINHFEFDCGRTLIKYPKNSLTN